VTDDLKEIVLKADGHTCVARLDSSGQNFELDREKSSNVEACEIAFNKQTDKLKDIAKQIREQARR